MLLYSSLFNSTYALLLSLLYLYVEELTLMGLMPKGSSC